MSVPRYPWLEAFALLVVAVLAVVGLIVLPADGELLSRLAVGAVAAAVFIARGGFGGPRPPAVSAGISPGAAAAVTILGSEFAAGLGALF